MTTLTAEDFLRIGLLKPGERTEETTYGAMHWGSECIDLEYSLCRFLVMEATDERTRLNHRECVVLEGETLPRGKQVHLPRNSRCLRIIK